MRWQQHRDAVKMEDPATLSLSMKEVEEFIEAGNLHTLTLLGRVKRLRTVLTDLSMVETRELLRISSFDV